MTILHLLLLLLCTTLCSAGTKSKEHPHSGKLIPYDNNHLPYTLTVEQNDKLKRGDYITINTRDGKSGRGVVIQDVNAPPAIVMAKIRDLTNYPIMVPTVKKVDIYDEVKHSNGTVRSKAEFNVGISIMSFTYYLVLTFEPKYHTFTWTLDYKYYSDFEDNTGHWQVVPHPSKAGWSRILYSSEVKLGPWIPEFVISYLTKTALVEANAWVKREAEKQAIKDKGITQPKLQLADVSPCFKEDAKGARYVTYCAQKRKPTKDEL